MKQQLVLQMQIVEDPEAGAAVNVTEGFFTLQPTDFEGAELEVFHDANDRVDTLVLRVPDHMRMRVHHGGEMIFSAAGRRQTL